MSEVSEALVAAVKGLGPTRALLNWHRQDTLVVAEQWTAAGFDALPAHAGVPSEPHAPALAAIAAVGHVVIEDADALTGEWTGMRAVLRGIGTAACAWVRIPSAGDVVGSIALHWSEPRQIDAAALEQIHAAAATLAPAAEVEAARSSSVATKGFHDLPVPLVVLDAGGGILDANHAAMALGTRPGGVASSGLDAVTDLNESSLRRMRAAITPIVAGVADVVRTSVDVWGEDLDVLARRIGEGEASEILVVVLPRHTAAVAASETMRAIGDGRATALYQPIVGVGGALVGAEALIRLRDPLLRGLDPELAVSQSERDGSISVLDRWVLARALDDLPALAAGDDGFGIAVNVGADTLLTGIAGEVASMLAERGLDPRRLTLEITERRELYDARAVGELGRLADLGVTIALDDFGAGYSSFAYLAELPVSVVKLDRAITHAGVSAGRGAQVARQVVALARALDLGVVAEGVESAAQLDFVTEVDCTAWQGFWCSGAVPVEHFAVAAASGRWAAPPAQES